MKGLLVAVSELTAKYVDLSDYRKYSCINIDKAVPDIKLTQEEEEEGVSDARAEQIKMNKRKKRRYKNSFLNNDNLIEGLQKDFFAGTTFHHFDQREKATY
jgi:hypothetical protein